MSADGLTLEGSAPLPAKLRGFYLQPLAGYVGRYQRGERTLKRWVSAGRHASPPDLPPFDDPPRMAAWFRRRFPRETVPASLVECETRAPAPVASIAEPPPPEAPPGPRITGINLDEMVLGEDEELLQMKALVAAHWQRVRQASESGDADGVRRWTPIHEAAVEQLRKTKKAVADWNRQMGKLILRDLVEAEVAQLIETLRVMRDSMDTRLLSELEKIPDLRIRRILRALRPHLATAIARVRQSETEILLNIESLHSPSALADQMQPAA